MTGNQGRDIMIWASRIHNSGQAILTLLSSYGLNVKPLSGTLSRLITVTTSLADEVELLVAKLIYYGLMPLLRFYMALWIADTWVFFIHRAEHSNQWLYSK